MDRTERDLGIVQPMAALDEEELKQLYQWVDEIPLTRPKKNISRDFSDGGNCLYMFKQNPKKKNLLAWMDGGPKNKSIIFSFNGGNGEAFFSKARGSSQL